MHPLALLSSLVFTAVATAQTNSTEPQPPDTLTIPGTAAPVPTNSTIPPEFGIKGILSIHCSGWPMPNDNFASIQASANMVSAYCNSAAPPVPARRSYLFRQKEAQIYWCNYAPRIENYELKCSLGQYVDAASYIDDKCGKGGGGWVEYRLGVDQKYSLGRDPRYVGGRETEECGW